MTRKFEAKKIPWYITIDGIRQQQQSYMEGLKTYLERRNPETSMDISPVIKRVKCSQRVEPSSIIKGRKQTTVDLETFIAADRERVFDVVICRVDRFWEWMKYRSDPRGLFEVSPDWPKVGSHYQYRIRTYEPFNKWETGTVSMLECNPPEHALLREEQNAHIYAAVMLIDWKFTELKGGTLLSVRYEITARNFIMNALFSGTPLGLEETIAGIIKICEKRK